MAVAAAGVEQKSARQSQKYMVAAVAAVAVAEMGGASGWAGSGAGGLRWCSQRRLRPCSMAERAARQVTCQMPGCVTPGGGCMSQRWWRDGAAGRHAVSCWRTAVAALQSQK